MSNHAVSPVDAVLIGYENQENLGLRSIMAYLLAQGYRAVLIPFFPGQDAAVLDVVQQLQPRLVGFSIIFQFSLDEFGALMHTLRENGVQAHFTAGGHFPSLRPEETLELLPDLTSVVRFEGELTLIELLNHLDQPERWEQIPGLAFRHGSQLITTPPRELITNLDSLPPVYREQPRQISAGIKVASMLASRGCLFNCSFCSIRQFYGSAPGALRRVRSPQAVAAEMLTLFNEKDVRFFSFQDDDFAARTPQQRKWLQAFLQALDEAKLSDRIKWKISCRVDDLEPDILEDMLDHGLVAVYLGVESGSATGLRTMNKHVTVAQNLAAIRLLKSYNVALAIGFMLFDPSSTVVSVRENIAFLQEAGSDGYFPINFCKMLPYAGTPIEAQLQKEGRLKGTIAHPYYGFLDPQIDWYAFLTQRIFTKRNFRQDGIVARLLETDFDLRLAKAFGYVPPSTDYEAGLRQLIVLANRSAVETLSTLLDIVVTCGIDHLLTEQKTLMEITDREWRTETQIEIELEQLAEIRPYQIIEPEYARAST